MNQFTESSPEIDPRLDVLLQQLRPTPQRDPQAESRGRAKFLAEAESILPLAAPSPLERMLGWLSLNHHGIEKLTMTPVTSKLAFKVIATLIVALAILFGGVAVTAYASQSALPGDPLYSVKTTLEQTRLALATNAAAKAKMHLDLAQRRLDEIADLIARERFDRISKAATEFEFHVQQAIQALEVVAAGDPILAQELTVQISAALSRYAQTLHGMLANLPESVIPSLEKAINTSRSASEAQLSSEGEIEFIAQVEAISLQVWTIGGRSVTITLQTEIKDVIQVGDQVKVHALVSADGSLTAREIELARPDQVEAEVEVEAQDEIEFTAQVQAITPQAWTIGGRTVTVTSQTEIKNPIKIGDQVKVHAFLASDGSLTAREIELAKIKDLGKEVRFVGAVEAITGTTWTVGGRKVTVDAQTEIRDPIQVGDVVEVRAVLGVGESLTAFRIKLEEDKSGFTQDAPTGGDQEDESEDDDNSGPGSQSEEDQDNSGSGSRSSDRDNSGPGSQSGDRDNSGSGSDEEDNSGPG